MVAKVIVTHASSNHCHGKQEQIPACGQAMLDADSWASVEFSSSLMPPLVQF